MSMHKCKGDNYIHNKLQNTSFETRGTYEAELDREAGKPKQHIIMPSERKPGH